MILLSFLPTLAYLLLLKAMDVFSMIEWRRVGFSIVYGIVCTAVAFLISRGYAWLAGASWEAVWISPLIEELLKAAPLLFIIASSHRIAFLAEAMIYGAAVGAGFALAENALYLYYDPSMSMVIALLRGFSTALLHLGCTALTASLALLLIGRMRKSVALTMLLASIAVIPSWGLHTIHNCMFFDPMLQTFVVIAGLLTMFYGIGRWSERRTVDWLDVSITTHVQLLSALREGQFTETKAGQYLLEIRERCDKEVFFDMVVYIQLYMELLIEAKSLVLLHEVGMDQPLTPEKKTSLDERYSELQALQQRIPHLQLLLLRPILQYNEADRWAIDNLIH